MEMTWVAIAASLLMGGGALMVFIWAVRQQHFKSFEDVKYQVFWSDPQDLAGAPQRKAAGVKKSQVKKEQGNG